MASTITALVFLGILLAVTVGQTPSTPAPPGGFYATRYDHIDIDNILNHKRLVTYYAKCMLGKGPCTPQGVEFKRILPEALQTNCARCTEKQRVVTTRSIRRLRKEYPDVWAELVRQWDPTGDHMRRFDQTYNSMYGRPNGPQTEVPLLLNRLGLDTNSKPYIPPTNAPAPNSTTTRFVRVTPPNPVTQATPRSPTAISSNGALPTSTSRVVRTQSVTSSTNAPPQSPTTPLNRQTTIYTVFRPNSIPAPLNKLPTSSDDFKNPKILQNSSVAS